MALINCKFCGKEVSDKAKTCPSCGGILIDDIIEQEEPQLLLCEECGAEIMEGSKACPKCGCPIQDKSVVIPAKESNTSDVLGVKKRIPTKVIAIIAAIAVLVVGFVFISSNTLIGDDKVAYELIVDAADNFRDPSSVRLVSGQVGVDKDCLFCGISAKNGFGTRSTGYYYISQGGWILEKDGLTFLYESKDELNIEKINKKLEKTLGYGD